MFGFRDDKAREIEALQKEERRRNIQLGIEKSRLRKGMRVFVSWNKYTGDGCHPNSIHTILGKSQTHLQTRVKNWLGDKEVTVLIPLDEHEFYSATGLKEAA